MFLGRFLMASAFVFPGVMIGFALTYVVLRKLMKFRFTSLELGMALCISWAVAAIPAFLFGQQLYSKYLGIIVLVPVGTSVVVILLMRATGKGSSE